MQRQLAARRYCACAIFESVSPLCTAIFTSEVSRKVFSGTTSCVPTAIRLGSVTAGLAASNSCQRAPRPRCCTAKLHRESPASTVTVCVGATTGDAGASATGTPGGGAISNIVGGVKVRRSTLNGGAVGAAFGVGMVRQGAAGVGGGATSEALGAVKVGRSMLNRGGVAEAWGGRCTIEGTWA